MGYEQLVMRDITPGGGGEESDLQSQQGVHADTLSSHHEKMMVHSVWKTRSTAKSFPRGVQFFAVFLCIKLAWKTLQHTMTCISLASSDAAVSNRLNRRPRMHTRTEFIRERATQSIGVSALTRELSSVRTSLTTS